MTDAQHSEEKEALQDAIGRTAIYRGVALCTPSITRVGSWVTHDDGSVTGPNYTVTCEPSPEVKALIDAAQATPVDPEPTPADPPPNPTPDPPPVDVRPAPLPKGGVYAAALAGLTLPVKSAWSDTRPAYLAQASIALADGTPLTVDTAKQVPDYVPSAGVWVYPFLQADGSRHPDLSLACYADCVSIGNVWFDAAANYAGHHTITINGTTVEDTDSRYDFGTYTAPCRTSLPQYTPSRAWDETLLPTYGTVSGGYTPWTAQLAKADNGVNGRSLTMPYSAMGTTGAQFSIGILPAPVIPWVVDGGDENWRVVRTVEDHTSCHPIHLRDRVTGLPAMPTLPHCIDVSLLDVYITNPAFAAGHVNPVRVKSTSPMKPDNAHCPGFAIAPYLATGSARDLEEVMFWAVYETVYGNPLYRQYGKCISGGQVRGVAWQLRSKGYAAKLCPADHPLHDGLQQVMANNAAWFTERYVGPDAKYGNAFGIMGGESNSFGYNVAGIKYLGMSPWMQDFVAAVTAQNIRMGLPGWEAFMGFLNIFTKARMGDGSADALWWTTAAFYNMFPRKIGSSTAQSTVRADYLDSWAAFNAQNLTYAYCPDKPTGIVGPYAGEVGKTIDTADLGKGPGVPRAVSPSATDFWANFQPALAALVDTGDGKAEWARYADAVLAQKDYHGGGQFNIVPSA